MDGARSSHGKNRNERSVLMGKHEENKPLGRTKNKCGITRNRTLNIQKGKLWNLLVHDKDQWRFF